MIWRFLLSGHWCNWSFLSLFLISGKLWWWALFSPEVVLFFPFSLFSGPKMSFLELKDHFFPKYVLIRRVARLEYRHIDY